MKEVESRNRLKLTVMKEEVRRILVIWKSNEALKNRRKYQKEILNNLYINIS